MYSHVFIGITDFDRAFDFYSPLMESLGIATRFYEREKPWAAWGGAENSRPIFVIGTPFDGAPHHPGNGQMVAFMAANRGAVHEAYRVALAHGGSCEGPPGLRSRYHANYYGAYFRDTEGNKLCVVNHAPAVPTE